MTHILDILGEIRELILFYINYPKEFNKLVSAIDDLRDAIDDVENVTTTGFAALVAALEELADDIDDLPNNDDVEAEAERLASITRELATGMTVVSQAIRDAVPTEPPTGESEF